MVPHPSLGPADLLDPAEQLVRNRRAGAPGCRSALLGRTAVATNPAVVEGVAEDVADPVRCEARLGGEPLDADRTDGVPLEERDSEPDGRGIDLDRVRRVGPPAEAQRRVASLIIVGLELRAVAVDDPFGQPPDVPLGAGSLGHELVPVVRVGGEDPAVAHD